MSERQPRIALTAPFVQETMRRINPVTLRRRMINDVGMDGEFITPPPQAQQVIRQMSGLAIITMTEMQRVVSPNLVHHWEEEIGQSDALLIVNTLPIIGMRSFCDITNFEQAEAARHANVPVFLLGLMPERTNGGAIRGCEAIADKIDGTGAVPVNGDLQLLRKMIHRARNNTNGARPQQLEQGETE